MTEAKKQETVKAPSTYQEWLECLAMMKSGPIAGNEAFLSARNGKFVGSAVTKTDLQKQIVETINTVLNNCAKRFVRNLNECFAFSEFSQIELLFKRLKKDIHTVMFFSDLPFLPEKFRKELEGSINDQMGGIWNETIRFLEAESLEYPNSDLDDTIFLVKRIKLFQGNGVQNEQL